MKSHKYCNGSIRLQSWDYRNDGAYFITINAANHKHFFGEIKNGEMHPVEVEKFAKRFWIEISNHFAHVKLGNFVVMPNNTHGVIIMDG